MIFYSVFGEDAEHSSQSRKARASGRILSVELAAAALKARFAI